MIVVCCVYVRLCLCCCVWYCCLLWCCVVVWLCVGLVGVVVCGLVLGVGVGDGVVRVLVWVRLMVWCSCIVM